MKMDTKKHITMILAIFYEFFCPTSKMKQYIMQISFT